MNGENGQFRTAVFGGFHRQDVLDYITRYAETSNGEIKALQEQADRLSREKEEGARELEFLRKEHQAAIEARDVALAQVEAIRAELDSRRAEMDDQRAELEALRQEAAQMREAIQRLQPEVEAMEQLKHQIADIELDARTRADQDALATRQMAERILEKARQNFDLTRTDVEATASHMMGEMERLMGMLGKMTTAFDEDEQAIAALRVEEE